MTFGRHWIAAAVSVPLLLVGGCSEDPEPIIEPPAETTPASDPSPTATPEAKEPWEKKTKAGAVAFAEHWFEVFSEAMQSANTDELRSLSAARCELCHAFADRLDHIAEAGGFYESEGWRVLQVSTVQQPSPAEALMALRIREGAERYKDAADEEVEENPAARATWSTRLAWTGDRWRLDELRLVE